MGTDLKTLFHHAPSEMSHSGFWAWFLESNKANTGPRAKLRARARKVIAELAPSGTTLRADENCSVMTEVPVDSGRLDIEVSCDEFSIAIENKVRALIDPTQLERYQQGKVTRKPTSFILMSLAFDEDTRSSIPNSWRYVELDEMMRWLAPTAGQHAITDEYLQYLSAEKEARTKIEIDARSPDRARYECALGKKRGQWLWIEQLRQRANLSFAGECKTNIGGGVMTQLRVANHPQILFFRLDWARVGGFYLSFRQYAPEDNSQSRRNALESLRARWSEAAAEVGLGLKMSRLSRGTKETKVAQYAFAENGGPEAVVDGVARLYKVFTKKIPEYSMRPEV